MLKRALLLVTELLSVTNSTSTLDVVKRLVLVYFFAHGGIFLSLNAVYWDDWVLYKAGDGVITAMFHEANPMLEFASVLHINLLKLGPWSYRVLQYLLMFSTGIFLWLILGRIKFLNQDEKYQIVVLFLVLPLYAARVALINFPGTLCYAIFFIAWFMLAKIEYLAVRILTLGLFLISFRNNAFLVFYSLPIAYLYYVEKGFTWKGVLSWCWRRIDFLLLPIIYFTIKTLYFLPTRHYSLYNQINLENVLGRWWYVLPFILLAGSVGVALVIGLRAGKRIDRNFLLVSFGVILIFIAMFPFLAVGKVPRFYDWDSRFQLLMPLGTSIVLVGFNNLIAGSFKVALLTLLGVVVVDVGRDFYLGRITQFVDVLFQIHLLWPLVFAILVLTAIKLTWTRLVLFECLVIGCVLVNLFVYLEYNADWQKQKYLISKIALSEEVRRASTIIVVDKTNLLNARAREYRFYEFSGWFKEAFGDETRLGVNLSQLDKDGLVLGLVPNSQSNSSKMYMTSNYHDEGQSKLLMTVQFNATANFFNTPLNVTFQSVINR